MEYPETTKEDIEDREEISIVVRVNQAQVFDDGNEKYYLQDIDGEKLILKIWADEANQYSIETDQWYLVEDAEGDVYQGDQKLSSNRGDMSVTELESPPESATIPSDTEEFEDLSDGGILAVDIETISTVSETDLDLMDSDHVELLCIGVGYAPEAGTPGDSRVLFRQGTAPSDEAELLERFCEYIESYDPDQLVMFRGEFDLQHLRGRADRVGSGNGISERVSELLDSISIVNLTPPGSLEENADVPDTYWDIYTHSLDPTDWRVDHPQYDGDVEDPSVSNKDIPYFGERFLQLQDQEETGQEYRALRELIRFYTVTDIDPLFSLVSTSE